MEHKSIIDSSAELKRLSKIIQCQLTIPILKFCLVYGSVWVLYWFITVRKTLWRGQAEIMHISVSSVEDSSARARTVQALMVVVLHWWGRNDCLELVNSYIIFGRKLILYLYALRFLKSNKRRFSDLMEVAGCKFKSMNVTY